MRALAGLLPAEGRIALNGRALAALPAGWRARTQHRLPAAGARLPLADERRRRGGAGTPSPCRRVLAAHRCRPRRGGPGALAATAVEPWAAVTTLSGGERARVALARALATQAPILLRRADHVARPPPPAGGDGPWRARRTTAARCWRSCTTCARRPLRRPGGDDGARRLVADGAPREVLTPERIAAVFGVDAVITDSGRADPILRRPL